MDTIKIHLLGRPQITLNGKNITADLSEKALALLIYLIAQSCVISRLEIAGMLWDTMDDDRARANLRAALHNLRCALPEILEVSRSSIALSNRHTIWLDLAELKSAVDLAGKEGFYSAFAVVLDVYRGDFLEGFYGNASPEFEGWILAEREYIRLLYLRGLELFTEQVMAHGDWQKALELTNRTLNLEPWLESAHRRMMRLYVRIGHCNRALTQFETCRAVLDQELGIAPEAETWQLYEKIRSASYCTPHNLPAFATAFIGREGELAILRGWLRQPGCRLVTITGLGGMGKTRLAVELGCRVVAGQERLFMHGVRYISLTERLPQESFMPVFARALGISIHSGQTPEEQLLNYLRNKEMLLVLDHMEAGAPETDFLPEILRAAPDVKIVVISQARTYLQGEWLFDLEGLSYPDRISAGQKASSLLQYDALQLFIACAKRLNLLYIAEDTVGAIVEICRLTEGMPLALELAAAHLREMEPALILDHLKHSLDILSARIVDLPKRHGSLRSLFETTWMSLSPSDRQKLASLVWFDREFSQEAARDLAHISPEVLTSFVDRSFLRMSNQHTYELPRLVRLFLQEREMILREPAR